MNRSALSVLYVQWLQGRSLRAIAAETNLGHSTLHAWFKKEFGVRACNRNAQSLVRSVVEDYPDQENVLEWALKASTGGLVEQQQHRSNHSMNMLSQFQTLDDDALWDTIAVADPESEEGLEFLRLPLYSLVNDIIVVLLNFQDDEQSRSATALKEAQRV